MHEFIGYTLSGLVTASIFATVACGLTLTYTTTGIFNWAQGSMVAVGAFSYWQFAVDWGWPRPLAIAACLLVVGPGLGWLLERVIMFRLEGTSETTRMVVTLALLLGTLGAVTTIWDPTVQRLVPPIADGHILTILGQRLPYNDLIVIGIAIAVAFALRALLYRTRTGVEMRATVDDRSLATLNGVSARRTAERSWMVSTTLAILAGILIAPRGGLNAAAATLLIVNAYAAAVIGRLRSLPMTVVGALVLGLATDYSQGYIGSRPDIPGFDYLVGLISVLPVVILFVSLQFLPQSRLRGTRTLRVKEVSPAPSWPGALAYAGSAVILAAAVAPLLAAGDLNSATKIWGYALISLSLVPLVGYAGRLSLCPMAFAAVGAMAVAHLGDGSPLGLLYAALITGAVGALVSLTAIRLSGLYLSLSTAAFAVMLDGWVLHLPPFTVLGHTIDLFQGGTLSITRFRAFGVNTQSDHAFFVAGAVLFALVTLGLTALRRSDLALRLIALKDSPVGYATLGLSQRLTTMLVFALSAAVAGLGGAVLGAAIQRPAPDVFTFLNGLTLLLPVVLLGVGSIGSALGTGVFLGAPALANLFPSSVSKVTSGLTGLAGIGLGQDPRGSIQQQIRPSWEPVLRARPVLYGGLGLIIGSYVLDVADVIGNYSFVLVLVGALLLMPPAANAVLRAATPRGARDVEADRLSAAPERLGLAVSFSPRDVEVLRGA